MARKMLIDATHSEETRVVVVNGNKVEEFDFDTSSSGLITGNIYLAKVSRIEPSLQAAFVEYGGNRHGFLAFSEIHPDYFQIPQSDREAILKEELEAQEAEAEADDDEVEEEVKKSTKSRVRKRPTSKKSADATTDTDDNVSDESEVAASNENADEAPTSDEDSNVETADAETAEAVEEKPKKSRTRRKSAKIEDEASISSDEIETPEVKSEEPSEAAKAPQEASAEDASAETSEDTAPKSKRRRSRSRSRSRKSSADVLSDPRDTADGVEGVEVIATSADDDDVEVIRENRRKPRAQRVRIHDRYKIQEVVKTRQVLLVQVIKEERGNKGAALTTYLSLPGRYCVLMPNTARGGGISRKISNVADRRRLKTLAKSFNVPQGAGLIVRTAGASQDSDEISRDYEFLTRQWNNIRELTLKSTAPSVVYAETGPIKRAIRDLLTSNCDEILIEGDSAFEEAKEYMNIIMPDRLDILKPYKDSMPLFSRYQVETHLSSMFNPTVQLPSGGYLVFGVTEALIAVDVNSGRSTKGASIEETAHKTNLEAAEEVARQLKLRDLAGLIVIDFIDMEQRRHQQEVENKLKDSLRKDRARIQVGRISNFGLLEMSRQRLRTGLVEAITKPCAHCLGTGIQRSDDSVALAVIRAIEEEIARGRSNDIVAKVPMNIANYLFNEKRDHILSFEARHGVTVRIEADHEQISPNFVLEKSKVEGKPLPKKVAPIQLEETDENAQGNGGSKRRRRRGGRGRNKSNDNNNENNSENSNAAQDASSNTEVKSDASSEQPDASTDNPKPKRTRRSRKKSDDVTAENASGDQAVEVTTEATAEDKPKPKSRSRKAKTDEETVTSEVATEEEKPKRTRAPRKPKAEKTEAAPTESGDAEVSEKPKRAPRKKKVDVEAETTEAPAKKPRASRKKVEETVSEPVEAKVEEVKAVEPTPAAEEKPAKPKRKGWWSLS